MTGGPSNSDRCGDAGMVSQNEKELAKRIGLESGEKNMHVPRKVLCEGNVAYLFPGDGIELGSRDNKSWRVSGPVNSASK